MTGYIFDLDGTIADSMWAWKDTIKIFLTHVGLPADEETVSDFFELTLQQTVQYLKEKFDFDISEEKVITGLNSIMIKFYESKVEAKPGAIEFLDKAQAAGIPMIICTSTDRPLVEAALNHMGISDYFKEIITTTEAGSGKGETKIFDLCLKSLGTTAENIWLFEDSLYAIIGGNKAGLKTLGIYEKTCEYNQDKIKEEADIYVYNWAEAIPKF